ncbi:adenosylcobinamide-GDP ribazoletransferase [bacterium]|nr:adenosylcobinamide-GDP ribazoletransferase [bacterium]
MHGFLVALQFLTIVPVKLKAVTEENLSRSVAWFPVVGLIIGAVLCLVNMAGMPPMVVKGLVLVALIVLTGGLHLDGFADTCDGFFSGKGKEETLAIMRDSRLGAMGVIGLILLLLLKFALLVSLPHGRVEMSSLLLMPAIGRWAMVVIGYLTPYARRRGGKGSFHTSNNINYRDFAEATLITLIVSLLLFGFLAILLMLTVYLLILGIRWFSLRKIGGITGDVSGAGGELSEILILGLICLGR